MSSSPSRVALVTSLLVGVLAGCGLLDRDPPPAETRVLVPGVTDAVGLTAAPDGDLLYGEAASGRILRVRPVPSRAPGDDDAPTPTVVAVVEAVAQAGDDTMLVGVARDPAGRVFAAVRHGDGRSSVLEVGDGERVVWEGAGEGATAVGALIAEPGRLVLVRGDSGQVVALRPDGPPTQRPLVLAGGLREPRAITRGPGGDWWLTDRGGPEGRSRVVRVLPGGELRTTLLDSEVDPVGIVSLGEGRLGLCDADAGVLRAVPVSGGLAAPPAHVVATGCAGAAVQLAGGEIVMIAEAGLEAFAVPAPAA